MSTTSTSAALLLFGLLFFLSVTASDARHPPIKAEEPEKPLVGKPDRPKGGTAAVVDYVVKAKGSAGDMDAAQGPSSMPPHWGVKEDPSFDADYPEPQTHPPSHN